MKLIPANNKIDDNSAAKADAHSIQFSLKLGGSVQNWQSVIKRRMAETLKAADAKNHAE
jgi:hypothetical protein